MNINNFIRSTAVAFGLVASGAGMTQVTLQSEKPASTKVSETSADKAAITKLFAAYNKALNTSDTAAVIQIYTDDGVFMPPYSPPAIGAVAIKKAYDNVFKQFHFEVKFEIAEIVQVSPQWAFARTSSAGTTTAQSTGAESSEGNEELFVLEKRPDAKWRIARYSFSPTSAPKK